MSNSFHYVSGVAYYYDGDTGTAMPTSYGYYGYVTGYYGLGSEFDYTCTNNGTYDAFGYDYYEADNAILRGYDFYWYAPNSGTSIAVRHTMTATTDTLMARLSMG